jgi:hypothetical protein
VDSPEVAVARYAARISLWALGLSAGALAIGACTFVLEMRRRFDEGVKLSMIIMVDAKFLGAGLEDENTYLAVHLTNRGSVATTITHFVLFNYPGRFALCIPEWLRRRMKRQRPKTYIVHPTGAPGPLPYVLEPGHTWVGQARHTPDIRLMIAGGRLYVGIIGSHSDKTLFKRVRHWTPPKDAKAA